MIRTRFLRFMSVAVVGGALSQLGGCSLTGLTDYLTSFNPCGSILLCDPLEFRFLSSGYQGPGVDPAIDPACTFPPFCVGDPFTGGNLP